MHDSVCAGGLLACCCAFQVSLRPAARLSAPIAELEDARMKSCSTAPASKHTHTELASKHARNPQSTHTHHHQRRELPSALRA
jgi:hypothetical protein